MKKKILIPIIIAIITLILAVLYIVYKNRNVYKASEQQIRFMEEINEANAVIWYYGDLDPGKEITINYKKVTEFTEDTIGDKDNIYDYHAVVIFDFDGKMDISDQELKLIKEYCEENYYDMLYYGNKHLEQFKKCGYFSVYDSNLQGFTYNGSYWKNRTGMEEYLNPYLLLGLWTETDSKYVDTDDEHYVWKYLVGSLINLIEDVN